MHILGEFLLATYMFWDQDFFFLRKKINGLFGIDIGGGVYWWEDKNKTKKIKNKQL